MCTAASCACERCAVAGQDLVDIGFHAIFVAVQDAPVQALLGGHAGGRVAGSLLLRCRSWRCCEILDEALQGIRAAVEDQVLGQLALLGRDFGIGGDVRRVDDRHIQPGLHGSGTA